MTTRTVSDVSVMMTCRSHRLDHQGYIPETWVGLLLTALYLIQGDRFIAPLNDNVELAVDAMLAVGSALCVLGAAIGTRLFFPRARRSLSYGLELLGLPLVILALAWFTWAATDASNVLLAVLGGGLGLCIEIASVRMFVNLVAATRELE